MKRVTCQHVIGNIKHTLMKYDRNFIYVEILIFAVVKIPIISQIQRSDKTMLILFLPIPFVFLLTICNFVKRIA